MSDSAKKEETFLYPIKQKENHYTQQLIRYNEYYKDPNNAFYFPAWNPSNDPSRISCSKAARLYLNCAMNNVVPFKSDNYADSRFECCQRLQSDLFLCLKVRRERDFATKKRMLEAAFPWVLDKTQGFRHRHVWRFRERPPPPFDDPTISNGDYALMRESAIEYRKGGIFSRLIETTRPHQVFGLLKLSSKDYISILKDKMKSFNVENSSVNSGALVGGEDRELANVYTDIAANSGDETKEAERREGFLNSAEYLLGDSKAIGKEGLEAERSLLRERIDGKENFVADKESWFGGRFFEAFSEARKENELEALVSIVWRKAFKGGMRRVERKPLGNEIKLDLELEKKLEKER